MESRAVYRNFAKGGGGQIWGMDKRGGKEAYVGCYALHLLGGARMTQGGQMPLPAPPLNTALESTTRVLHIYMWQSQVENEH